MRSSVSNDGGTEIEVSTIDDICGEIPVTFIKMDIEGSKLRALKGAKNTILKNKPKLAICIYHRAEDIFEIPRYIDDLAPGYKFFIRHYCFYEDETVLYAIQE